MRKLSRTDLAPDYTISRVIKGNWQLSTGHTPGTQFEDEHVFRDMDAFVDAGITTFDFGDIYRGVEEMIGRYLHSRPSRRSSIQLHTKYVPDIDSLTTHSLENVRTIIDRSCRRLCVERLDLVQFHWWNYDVPRYIEAMYHLQRLQQEGKIRLLGVTNFDVKRMQEFVDAGITPASIQLQYSLLDHRPEHGMVDFCRSHGIQLLCYGTVAGGFLSERYLDLPEPKAPYETRSLTKYKLIVDAFGGWELFQLLLRVLKSIANKHSASISTVASAYILQKPQVAAVIVGARNASHIGDNASIAHLHLDTNDLRRIHEILADAHPLSGDVYDLERYDSTHAGIIQTSNNAA